MTQQVLWTTVAIILSFLLIRLTKRVLGKAATHRRVNPKRLFYIEKVFQIMILMTLLIALMFAWSVDIKSISLVASSLFAVIGVALFAQWSILSNITASIIIFFNFPARVGDRIKIVDGDNSITGSIHEINLFHVELKDDEGSIIFYPNNLLLQRPVVKLKADDTDMVMI